MQRGIAWLLLLCMLLFAVPAMAQESFTMAGYDDSSVGHVWEDNLFFQRMEEKQVYTLPLISPPSTASGSRKKHVRQW